MAAYKDEQRGTWYVSFHYYDWTGKNCRKVKRGFKTKREATEWEHHFRMKEAADLDMTFGEFVQAYTRDMKPKLKHNTWLTKEHILRTKLLPYFENKKMCDIRAKDIIQWQNEQISYRDEKGKPYAPTYLKTLQSELSALFNHAVRFYELKSNPVLDFEKQERQKEVAELEQTISGSREELSDILHQQIAAGQETEQIRKEGEAIRQEVSELTATNHLLKEQKETLTEDKEKLLSENEKLEKQQKKLQQELNKMVQSKEVMECNIHAYDEDVKWQLAEPGALMSAKNYRDKKALPLVEKLKEVVKNLTIKCVQLTEQSRKLTAKVDGQQKQISRLTDKVMEQSDTIDRLQEKVSDLGRLERHLGREQVQSIVERSKVLEQAERAIKRPKRAFEMSR